MSDVLKEHQRQVLRGMFVRPNVEPISHAALGLAGEVGEVVDHIKKGQYYDRDIDVPKLKEELGDALWYMQFLLGRFGWTLEEIARENLDKLAKRYPGKYTPL